MLHEETLYTQCKLHTSWCWKLYPRGRFPPSIMGFLRRGVKCGSFANVILRTLDGRQLSSAVKSATKTVTKALDGATGRVDNVDKKLFVSKNTTSTSKLGDLKTTTSTRGEPSKRHQFLPILNVPLGVANSESVPPFMSAKSPVGGIGGSLPRTLMLRMGGFYWLSRLAREIEISEKNRYSYLRWR